MVFAVDQFNVYTEEMKSSILGGEEGARTVKKKEM